MHVSRILQELRVATKSLRSNKMKAHMHVVFVKPDHLIAQSAVEKSVLPAGNMPNDAAARNYNAGIAEITKRVLCTVSFLIAIPNSYESLYIL